MKRILSLLALLTVGGATVATAQINYSGGTYSENFDGLLPGYNANNTGIVMANVGAVGAQDDLPTMANWKAARVAAGGTGTFGLVTSYGDNNGGRLYCYWLPIGATDRALGSVASGTTTAGFGTSFLNSSLDTYEYVTISFDRELWRTQTSTTDQRLTFAYGLASSGIGSATFLTHGSMITYNPLNAVAPGSLGGVNTYRDGNSAPYSAPVSATITGISWAPGDTLFVRWNDSDDALADAGIAIDNLTMVAVVPEPSCGLLLGLGVAALALLRRNRR